MFKDTNCINKKRIKVKSNPCLECEKKWDGCRRKHEMIDSNIIVNKFLKQNNYEKSKELLDLNQIKYTGYLSIIQVGHIIKAILNKKQPDQTIDYEDVMSELSKFHLLEFNDKAEIIYNNLKEKELRMESHDLMNVAIAIANKIYLQVDDRDLEDDFPTIREVSSQFGWKIKINEEYN